MTAEVNPKILYQLLQRIYTGYWIISINIILSKLRFKINLDVFMRPKHHKISPLSQTLGRKLKEIVSCSRTNTRTAQPLASHPNLTDSGLPTVQTQYLERDSVYRIVLIFLCIVSYSIPHSRIIIRQRNRRCLFRQVLMDLLLRQ